MELNLPITSLKGLGADLGKKFEKLEIRTLGQLLNAFPRQYLDYSEKKKISELEFDRAHTLVAKVVSAKNFYLRRKGGSSMQVAKLEDETGRIDALWFNMPYIAEGFVPGEKYAFVAKLSRHKKTGKVQLNSPVYERISGNQLHSGRIVPVYHLTQGLSPKRYRRFVKQVVDNVDLFKELQQNYDPELIKKYFSGEFLDLAAAYGQVHFPESFEKLDLAKFRLGVEELVPIQEKLLRKAQLRAQAKPIADIKSIKASEKELGEDYWKHFEFKPTAAQSKVCAEIYAGFKSGHPEYRLLQGDVGSGKTAVAGFAAYLTLLAKRDVVLMVPTTILAEQHYSRFWKMFPDNVELVTAETSTEKKRKGNQPRFLIGTQALLHRYAELDLEVGTIIVDEEHRFGVAQREEIAKLADDELEQGNQGDHPGGKGKRQKQKLPHYLSVTATPIPRTMALAVFGNIDVSVITTPPAQQLPKISYLVPDYKRSNSYEWIRERINEGNQVFWVCPLIETTVEVDHTPVIYTKDEKASVEVIYERLCETFPPERIAKLHGKLKPATKSKILEDFKARKYDILVSTTVIEVGIDIPNANLIVIESANNFGLAQLHQLRGRVGRGTKQGYCLLFEGENTSERLQYFSKETDGLKLAEYDLKQRGPGEVYGHLQSGVPNLAIADLSNKEQVELAGQIAQAKILP